VAGRDAIRDAHARGVRVRIMFNEEEREEEPRPFEPPPPRTERLAKRIGAARERSPPC
jgi:phosphatidylserine/phosphatidylglycerophosphate/cardiolipin synthase-like enzyme